MRTIKGTCHCGAVEFEADLDFEIDAQHVRRCNCSLCRRKGALMSSVPKERLRVTRGADNLALYQWNTKIAKHFFCRTCGIYTHHFRRSAPTECGFNVACIDGVDPFEFNDVSVFDGAAMSLED